jgi:tellurite resistance protein TerC
VRVVKIVVGFLLLVAGVAMLALPGPGWLTIVAGLALLAAEFEWARRALDKLKETAGRIRPRKRH